MIGLQVSLIALLLNILSLTSADGHYILEPMENSRNLERNKRYTDSQDRASAFCTGMCMYEQRKAYSDCYDLCNWNGRGASPWIKLDQMTESSNTGNAGGENSVANMQSLMRSGAGGGRLKAGKSRRKNKADTTKELWHQA